MGGRGSSSGMSIANVRKETTEIVEFIRRNERAFGTLTSSREKDFEQEIAQAISKGYKGLEEGSVISYKGNKYVVKEGDHAAGYLFKPTEHQRHLDIFGGKVRGQKGEKKITMELDDEKRKKNLKQAIITRIFTRIR